MLKSSRKILNSEKGMAVLEIIPILVMFVLLISFTLGFFGVIHTGILQSISTRNYAFETFAHRQNLVYLRSNADDEAYKNSFYQKSQVRYHYTVNENLHDGEQRPFPSERAIRFYASIEQEGRSDSIHSGEINKAEFGQRYTGQGVNPVWIKVAYGICLTAACGK
jgi:hypothetical protein